MREGPAVRLPTPPCVENSHAAMIHQDGGETSYGSGDAAAQRPLCGVVHLLRLQPGTRTPRGERLSGGLAKTLTKSGDLATAREIRDLQATCQSGRNRRDGGEEKHPRSRADHPVSRTSC